MTNNSLWCPNCGKKGLNFYDKNNSRPDNAKDIRYCWCLYCNYHIRSEKKKSSQKNLKK